MSGFGRADFSRVAALRLAIPSDNNGGTTHSSRPLFHSALKEHANKAQGNALGLVTSSAEPALKGRHNQVFVPWSRTQTLTNLERRRKARASPSSHTI